MSRTIDLTKPLSDEDRTYLQARNRMRDIALADAAAAGQDAPAHDGLPNDSIAASTERSPSAQPAALAAQTTDAAPAADSPLASPATEHTADAVAADSEDDGDNYDDDSAWSYEELKDEIKYERTADDKPALNSSREDLIVWLRMDDARTDATDAS